MGWVKDEGGCSASHDGTTRVVRERYLLGGGESPVAVCKSPTAFLGGDTGDVPLPARNSAHPIDTGVFLDCYQVDSDGAVNSIVALYSSDRRFRFPTNNVSPDTGYTWSLDDQDQFYSVPYAVKVKELVTVTPPSGGVGPPEPVYREPWKDQTENIYESGQIVRLTFKVKPADVEAAKTVIYTRQNKIHLIGAELWWYRGGSLVFRNGDYEMSVAWVKESGVPDLGNLYDRIAHNPVTHAANPVNDRVVWPSVTGQLPGNGSTLWAKVPYHKTIPVSNDSGNPEDPPWFYAQCQFAYDPTGYAAVVALIP